MILSFSLLRLRGASCLQLSTTSGQVNYSKVAMASSSMMGAKKTQQQYSTKSQLRGNSRLFVSLTNNVPARGNFSTTTTTTTTKTTIHRDNATLDTDQINKNSNTTYDFDYLVIGAGSGGIASARRAASYGARVGVIEQSKLGGTCVNVGCVPKKIMFNAASIAEALHDMEHYGFSGYDSGIIHFDWKFLQTNRDAYIQRLNDIYGKNMQTSGVQRINGTATLTGPQQVTVTNTAQNTQNIYTAPHILIATGGYPLIPEGEGIAENVITSDGFFHLQDLPHKAVVAGAGYIAVEMAGILQALGTDTSLVLRHHRILRTFDEMIAETLEEELIRKGIHIYRNTLGIEKIVTTSSSSSSQSLKSVHLQNGEVIHNVDTVIVATGRAPMVQPLNLSAMGIQQKEDGGYIVTNEYSETNVKGIYAVGDVCGKRELTPMAIAAGRRLADRLFGPPEQFQNAKVSYDLVPTVIFSHPPVGTIGLTESEAIAKYGKDSVQIYRSKFANMYYGPWNISPDDKPKTAMKLICVGPEQLVVGLHVVGIGADEMLQGFAIALKMGATKADFDATLAIHPTAAEEFVTMFPWGKSLPISGAKQSPLNGADPPEPIEFTKHP